MITLITGAPRAGKTALAVVLALDDIKEGRACFVHGLDGPTFNHFSLEDPHQWHNTVPDGALIFIDEVQSVWRPARSGATVPEDVQALETHGHRGLDFILTTQHPNLLHANVRRLVGRHVHLQDFGILGRRWYEWSECSDCSKSDRASALVKKPYKLPKRVFNSYTSASMHVKPKRGFPLPVLVAITALPVSAAFAYTAFNRIVPSEDDNPQQVAAAAPISTPQTATRLAAPPPPPSAPVAPEKPKLAGCIQMADRCECIDTTGQSIEVDLAACIRDASRSGVGLAYPVEGQRSSSSSSTAATSQPIDSDPVPAYGFDAGETREALQGQTR